MIDKIDELYTKIEKLNKKLEILEDENKKLKLQLSYAEIELAKRKG